MNSLIEIQLQSFDHAHCFDCGADNPRFVSLNNGIIICLSCASKHRELGPEISLLKSITLLDQWNEKNVKYFQKGGNERLKAFFEKYKIQDFPIEKKYRTKAASYYRDKLNCEIEEKEIPKEIDAQTAQEPIIPQENLENKQYFDEIWGYLSSIAQKTTEIVRNKSKETKEFGGKMLEISKEKYEQTKEFSNNLVKIGMEKLNETKEISEKLLEKSKERMNETYEFSKEKMRENYEKGKEITNETYEKSKEKINETYEKGIEITNEIYQNSKEKINESIEKINNFQEIEKMQEKIKKEKNEETQIKIEENQKKTEEK